MSPVLIYDFKTVLMLNPTTQFSKKVWDMCVHRDLSTYYRKTNLHYLKLNQLSCYCEYFDKIVNNKIFTINTQSER